MKKVLLTMTAFCAAVSLNAQIIYSEDFSDPATSGFTAADLDGDMNTWGFYDVSASTALHLNPLGTAAGSQSWDGTIGLNPDNLLISPAIDLSAASGTLMLMWDVASVEDAGSTFAAEEYEVYVVNDPADVATASSVSGEIVPDGGQVYTRSVDISGMAGSATVYVVIRHFNTFDMNLLIVDNIMIEQTLNITENSIEASVYPNPAGDVLNIKTTGVASNISIISLDGKVISTQVMNGTFAAVNVADLQVGAYFYQVTAEDGSVVTNTFMKK